MFHNSECEERLLNMTWSDGPKGNAYMFMNSLLQALNEQASVLTDTDDLLFRPVSKLTPTDGTEYQAEHI